VLVVIRGQCWCPGRVPGIQLLQPFMVVCITRQQKSIAEMGIQPAKGCNWPLEMGQVVSQSWKEGKHVSVCFLGCRLEQDQGSACCLAWKTAICDGLALRCLPGATIVLPFPTWLCVCRGWAEAKQIGIIGVLLEKRPEQWAMGCLMRPKWFVKENNKVGRYAEKRNCCYTPAHQTSNQHWSLFLCRSRRT